VHVPARNAVTAARWLELRHNEASTLSSWRRIAI
jgi:hypothetical protein